MNTVAIFGVGLIGGSFALALRKAGFQGRIIGVSSPQTIARAVQLGVVDAGVPAREAAETADLIYLAQPISQILESMRDLNTWVSPHALVTDVGSTKAMVVAQAARELSRCRFLGGHPLAGKEQRGVDAADPNLFAGRKYVFTPVSSADMEAPLAQELKAWVTAFGATPVIMDAEKHDQAVAYTSHLAQLASTALAATLQDSDMPVEVSGPALIDITRLALSPFEIWSDILATNIGPIRDALASYISMLEQMRQELGSERMAEHFQRAAKLARGLRNRPLAI